MLIIAIIVVHGFSDKTNHNIFLKICFHINEDFIIGILKMIFLMRKK